VGYYIQDPAENSALTSPTLYRVNFSSEFTSGASDTLQPLVEGVKDLDILYGVRDGQNLIYKKADSITNDEWPLVSVVRLEILAESLTEVEGSAVERTFVRTIKLRNRI
jgi:type IV pilus assembly protein PilW